MIVEKNVINDKIKRTTAFLLLGFVAVFVHSMDLSAKPFSSVNLDQLEQECKQNNWESCETLSGLYLDVDGEGKKAGVKKDIDKGLKILERACELGSGEYGAGTCMILGALHLGAKPFLKGMGMQKIKLKKDTDKGLKMLERACELGSGEYGAVACMILGALHLNAKPFLKVMQMGMEKIKIKKDINKGLATLEKCSNFGGEVGAICSGILGALYSSVEFQKVMGVTGMSTNKSQAKRFLQRSCKLGDEDGCSMLKELEEEENKRKIKGTE